MNPLGCTSEALLSEPTITSIVDQRVEIAVAPAGKPLPDIILVPLTNEDTLLVTGPGGFLDARVRIECRGRTREAAILLGDTVIAFLNGHSGTYAGMQVDSWLKEALDELDHAEDFSVYRRFFDFKVRYRAA